MTQENCELTMVDEKLQTYGGCTLKEWERLEPLLNKQEILERAKALALNAHFIANNEMNRKHFRNISKAHKGMRELCYNIFFSFSH